jgi:hypothetical protein
MIATGRGLLSAQAAIAAEPNHPQAPGASRPVNRPHPRPAPVAAICRARSLISPGASM